MASKPQPRKKTAAAARKSPTKKAAPSRVPVHAPAPRPAVRRPAAAPKEVKADKPRKAKLVRDSFTIPKAEFAVLQELKQRSSVSGTPAKKSEILRAGIMVLAGMNEAALRFALSAVPPIKTGRPARE
jgi:hypothetical protein